jgi:hypothetical protein
MKNHGEICKHRWASLGFQKVSTDETKVEVIAAIFCELCGMFRTKILYFDRQKDKTS